VAYSLKNRYFVQINIFKLVSFTMAATLVSEGVEKELIQQGNGPKPKRGDQITVHCTGLLAETGKKFWSTKDPGQKPFSFKVGIGQVISGWDEGCLTMAKGEIARLKLAPHKGYGAQGFPAWGISPNAPLIFDIEVLSINGQ
jgi:FKBP-type peptidyl-prolyl cis-trans isomerase